MKLIVHTGAAPGTVLVEEPQVLNVPDVEFVLRGKCSTPAQLIEAVRDADAALCSSEPFTREVFANAPRLKVVVRYGIGVDTIDLEAATEHGVVIANFPDFCIDEVANHALVLLLDCAKKITRLDRTLREKGWAAARNALTPMGTIHHQVVGLVGFGNIGQALAQRALALKMQVIAYDPYVAADVFEKMGVEQVSLQEVAQRSDFVSVHVPLTAETRGLIDATFLQAMRPSAYLINTSRGPVVNEGELIAALRDGTIAGAALDVYQTEPIPLDHPLCQFDNVVLTPHSASYADATFASMRRRVAQSALAVVRGGLPEFVANPAVLANRRR
ncbi:MAG: C-terminal binding protein [Chloroflexi bacterium]|jgi:D-3-phosphoglycerate dehydrogenase|nr:C-terminal binding protein [Chloroflexota bacterium]